MSEIQQAERNKSMWINW